MTKQLADIPVLDKVSVHIDFDKHDGFLVYLWEDGVPHKQRKRQYWKPEAALHGAARLVTRIRKEYV